MTDALINKKKSIMKYRGLFMIMISAWHS